MSNDNYPAGVTDAHPHFNPPREVATDVECGADEALVVPSFHLKAALSELAELLDEKQWTLTRQRTAILRVAALQEQIRELEQESSYTCPFHDDLDLEESECARWVCPVCGNDRETDTLPEEQDPDRAYEEMRDARYDD